MLAGLPQAPSLYSPLRSPGAAKARRNDVLREMARSGMITQQTAQKTMRRGLGLDPSTYFTRRRESYFFDYVKDELIKEYGAKTVRLGGLQVRTTVDLKKQQEARAAIAERLGDIGPSSAIVTINPKNGYIEAMASSAGYGESKFNLAAQGHRQPGLDVQGDGADGRAAGGRGPRRHALRLQVADQVRRPDLRPDRRLDLRRLQRGQHQPAQGDAALGQLRLHPARARRRPRQGQAGRLGPRDPLQAQRLPGRDARRPDRRRLAAGDGQRLRDDRLGRHAQPADRDHAGDVPRRDARSCPRAGRSGARARSRTA